MKRIHSGVLRYFIGGVWHWIGLLALMALLLGSAGIRLVAAHYLGLVVENGMAGRFESMLSSAICLAAALIGSFLYGIFQSYCSALLVESFFSKLRIMCFHHAVRLPMDKLEIQYTRGDLVARINQDLTRLNETIAGKWAWLGQSAITAAVALAQCFAICWPLALLYSSLLPLFLWMMASISRSTQRQHLEEAEAMAATVQRAADILNGFDMVKAYRLQMIMEKRFQDPSDRLDTISINVGDKLVHLGTVRYRMTLAALLVIFLAGRLMLRFEWITLSGLISFLTLSQSVQNAVGLMDNVAYAVRIARADLARIDDILAQPLEDEQWNMPRDGL